MATENPLTLELYARWARAARRLGGHAGSEIRLGARSSVASGTPILRHTFCSHPAMAGTPLPMIQKLARHADIQTTMKYIHVAPNDMDVGLDMLIRSRANGGAPVSFQEAAAQ